MREPRTDRGPLARCPAILANGNAQQQIKLTELLADEASPNRCAGHRHPRCAFTACGTTLKALAKRRPICRSSSPALAQTSGRGSLFAAVEVGAGELLLDIHIRDRSEGTRGGVDEEFAESAEAERLIADRIADCREKATPSRAKYLRHNCAACHKFDGIGADIGPQLEGIGNPGIERLVEETIDPNRNIDVAFHYTIAVLKDGRIITGLKRREWDNRPCSPPSRARKSQSKKRDRATGQSPASILTGFGQAIPSPDFRNLLEYLLGN